MKRLLNSSFFRNARWLRVKLRFRLKLNVTRRSIAGTAFLIEHRGSANDLAAINGCFRDQQYRIPDVAAGYAELAEALYSRIIQAGHRPLIVDCGANIGAASLWFRAMYPKAHIVAVEPAVDNFEYLTRNTSAWDVEGVHAGIDGVDGVAFLMDPGYGPDGYRTGAEGCGEPVPMISMDSLIRQHAPASVPFILKVDIEGYESNLFEGNREALSTFPVIIVETHDWLLPGKGTALNFFSFHTEHKRDYIHHNENVFSLDYKTLSSGPNTLQVTAPV